MTQQDFIEVYPDAVPVDVCRAMVAKFEASGQASPGRTAGGVDEKLKKSADIGITGKPEWAAEGQVFQQALLAGLLPYVRKYAYMLIGGLALRLKDPATGTERQLDLTDVQTMPAEELQRFVFHVLRPGNINLQKYVAGVGGYPHWHSEICPQDARCEPLHRVLLWTVYLNDIPEAGETEFYYQQRKITPRTGNLLIAPAGFTHTHRGNTPVGADKYIATSWVMFQRSEQLFGK